MHLLKINAIELSEIIASNMKLFQKGNTCVKALPKQSILKKTMNMITIESKGLQMGFTVDFFSFQPLGT